MENLVVTSDDRTVIVKNEKGILAEYNKRIGRVFRDKMTYSIAGETWESWVGRVLRVHKIKIGHEYELFKKDQFI